MKKLLSLIALFSGTISAAHAQHVYQIRADSVRIYNVCDTAELIIENRTRGISGYLYNKGNGRTEFRKIDLIQVGGSKLAIAGQDTIDLAQMSGVGGIDTIYRLGDNIRYVKQGVMRDVFAPLAPADSIITLQNVTKKGNVTPYDIVFNSASGNPSNGLQWAYNTDFWRIHVESPQDSPAGNMIFESNDNGQEGWIFRAKTPGTSTDVLKLNRDFSKLHGYFVQTPFALNQESNVNYQFWNALGGAAITPDPEFRRGTNGLNVYNNVSTSNAVKIERSNAVLTAAVPNSSGFYLKVTTTPDDGPNTTLPGLGGVALRYLSSENKVYVTRMKALIPVGYTLKPAANAFGTNAMSYWLTSDKGTGKWEDYVHVYVSGNAGTFQDICYFYLDGPMQPTSWYVGYFDFKIASSSSWTDNIPQNLATGRPTELYFHNDSLRLSKGDAANLRISTPHGLLELGALNPTFAHYVTDREGHYFNKPLQAATKLAIYNTAGPNAATTYLTQTEGRINNSPILTQANAGGNFIVKQVDTSQTGNLSMKGMIQTETAFSSRIGNGYASYRIHNSANVLRFGVGIQNAESGNGGADFHIWRYDNAGVVPTAAMTIARINGAVTFPGIIAMANNSKVTGDGNGNTNYAVLGFYNNLNNRVGYVGKGANANMDIHLSSDSGNVVLFPKGGSTLNVGNVELSYTGGTFAMKNGASNNILFPAQGVGAPVVNIRSIGTRIVLSPSFGATTVDYAIGVESNNVWFSTSATGTGFKWYGAGTNIATLTGAGNMTLSGTSTATAFYQSSLRSLKKNIEPFTGSALRILGKAQVRTFLFKSDSTAHRNIGFIADEVPDEMATPGRNGVDQASTVGLLVKAVQELKAEKDALAIENKALAERLLKLEAAMDKLIEQQKAPK